MRVYKNWPKSPWRLTWVVLLLLSCPATWANGFTIRSVDTRLADKVYQLNAEINYQLSGRVIEALQNGVPIVIMLDIKVEKHRSWWLNKTVAELKQGYMLLYHALSAKYILNNLNSGVQQDFSHIEDAIDNLEHVDNLPIIDAKLVDAKAHYAVKIRTYLDLDSLPAPVRPLAYLSPNWRLESDWYQWPLQN
ncbi:MAG: DUF4390 domain-containing protein [Gammaproteobacteria bacterium]|nr:DUF4390 domain-containing protein [Gammaproteobacteria bacterium]